MNVIIQNLELWLRIFAAVQLAVALLNLRLVDLMNWKPALAKVDLLMREVFYVHAWFISLMLAIFAAFTWRFAGEMAAGTNPAATAVALGAGIFWGLRTWMQLFYYSSTHWRGRPGRTTIHLVLLALYGSMAAIYLISGLGGGS